LVHLLASPLVVAWRAAEQLALLWEAELPAQAEQLLVAAPLGAMVPGGVLPARALLPVSGVAQQLAEVGVQQLDGLRPATLPRLVKLPVQAVSQQIQQSAAFCWGQPRVLEQGAV